jgi:hypothetical protein
MTFQAIDTFLQARPFRSLKLVTASGEVYTVPHPEFMTFSPSKRTCNVYAKDGEFFSTLDVFTITDIQPNGRSRKKLRRPRSR